MDAVSIISLGGTIISIVEIIAKSIKTLRKLQLQWQTADWTISCLLGQLGTLKLALNQINEWICSDLKAESQHQSLVDDLCTSLDCCRALISSLDSHISQLEWGEAHKLAFESRVKTILNDSLVRDFVMQLNGQSTALNLLLTALNW